MDFESWKDSAAGKSIAKQINKSINEIDLKDNKKSFIEELDFVDDIKEDILYDVYDTLITGIENLQLNVSDFVDNIDEQE